MTHPVLQIQLLGGFNILYDNEPVTRINSPRLQSLLAYLILHADLPQLRQHLAFLLWPDTTESNARNNLRQFFYQLRHALPNSDRFLIADANIVSWKTDEDQVIDLQRFNWALRGAELAEKQGDTQAFRRALERVRACYHGDLLPGCYDDWITPERERYQKLYYNASQKLIHLLEAQRDYAAALQIAQELQRIDPLDESIYVSLLRLYGLSGDHTGARRTYQIAVDILQRELGVEPGDELRAAYERLQKLSIPIVPLRPEVTFGIGSMKLVARRAEWQQMQAAWRRATNGDAHLFLITGEAGIGKSRLAEELFTWATSQGFATAYTRSYGAEGRLSLAPITEWLRSEAIHPHLATLDQVWLTEIARLLPELLVEHTGLARPEPISEYGRRQLFFEALARGLHAGSPPLLLWIDDLQWCDQDTLDWLHFILRFEPHYPLLILGTARSEESPPDHPLSLLTRQLRMENKVSTVELSALDAAETAKLASQVLGYGINETDTIHLFRNTEGNPLFVVETVRANMAGSQTVETSTMDTSIYEAQVLPPRVQAVIVGRLVQLSPQARKVAEIGAAIGHHFTLDLLLHVVQESVDLVTQALDELWQKRIIREQSVNVFDFTHDKLREVAYFETSLPQRRLLHRHIAQALEVLGANNLEAVSAQIAVQYEQAGLFEQALPYFQRASFVAASMYANDEAIALLVRALALLSHFPSDAKRDSQELHMQLALSSLFSITKGWTSPDVEQCLNRAQILSDKVGDLEQKAQTLYGLEILYIVQARLDRVRDVHPEMHRLFVMTQGSLPQNAGLMYAGTSFHMGHLLEARQQFESIIAVKDDKNFHSLLASQGWNHEVHGQSYLSHTLWCLGYPRLALNSIDATIDFAQKIGQPFDRAKAATYRALLHEWCAGFDTFYTNTEDAYLLTSEYRAPYYHAWASILLSFARAQQQPDADNLARLHDAIRTFTETGAHLRLPVYFSLLARAYYKADRFEDGLVALEQAFSESRKNKELWWDAELHRLRGELLWAKDGYSSDVEASFQRALDIARAQQAKSLELRAANSLARLWQATHQSTAAKQLLVPLYNWFSEGFDTPDLQTAHSLITIL